MIKDFSNSILTPLLAGSVGQTLDALRFKHQNSATKSFDQADWRYSLLSVSKIENRKSKIDSRSRAIS
jgi:hypothetical protein